MKIEITYDSSVAGAPAGFKTVVADVVKFYDSLFGNPITINIDVGWGEVDGSPVTGALGESVENYFTGYTYSQIKTALTANAVTADSLRAVSTLGTDPTGGAGFGVNIAEGLALGLSTDESAISGYVGFDSAPGTFDFKITSNTSSGTVPAGETDLFGVVAHEISEVMGRGGSLGSGGIYFPLDLFDYSGPGVRNLNGPKTGRYFSIDGGTTNLDPFNGEPSGDTFDWAAGAGNDAYDAFSSSGVINLVTPADITLMNLLGYQPTPDFTAVSLALAGATLSFRVDNVSPGPAVASTAGVYLSTTPSITTTATRLTRVATSTIAGDGSVSLAANLTFSASLAAGTYYLGVIADYNGAVAQSDTANDASGGLPIVILGAANVAAVNGVAGVAAFDAGGVTLGGALTLEGSLTTSAALAGAETLKVSGGDLTFDAGTSLTVTKLVMTGAAVANVEASLSFAGDWDQGAGTVTVAAGRTLTLSGTKDVLAGAFAGAGAVDLTGADDALKSVTLGTAKTEITAASATLAGTIDLTGLLTVASADLVVTAAPALIGGGTLELTNSAANRVVGGSAATLLTNADLIEGAGDLGGGAMRLSNAAGGIIDGDASAGLIIDVGTSRLSNDGLIEAAGPGSVTIKSAVSNTGTLAALGGVLIVDGAVSGAGVVEIDKSAVATFGAAFAENVAFTAAGRLTLADAVAYSGTITGFSRTGGTSLDLEDIDFADATASYSGTTASGVFTVTDGTHRARIKLAGDYLTAGWTLSNDGAGGTVVVDPASSGPSASRMADAMASFGPAAANGAAPFHITESRTPALVASLAQA